MIVYAVKDKRNGYLYLSSFNECEQDSRDWLDEMHSVLKKHYHVVKLNIEITSIEETEQEAKP